MSRYELICFPVRVTVRVVCFPVAVRATARMALPCCGSSYSVNGFSCCSSSYSMDGMAFVFQFELQCEWLCLHVTVRVTVLNCVFFVFRLVSCHCASGLWFFGSTSSQHFASYQRFIL